MTALPDVRCPYCKRLLLRGEMRGEIRCPKCQTMVRFSYEAPKGHAIISS